MLASILARPALRIGLIVASGVALMTAGAAAWDRMPIVGPHAKIVGLRAELKAVNETLAVRTGEREGWRKRAGNCEAVRLQARNDRAQQIPVQETETSNAERAAFDRGYAAGRAVGRKQCEVKANANDPLPAPGPVAGRVSDGGVSAWNADRYQPNDPLPR